MVVKIMVNFWIPIIIRQLIFRETKMETTMLYMGFCRDNGEENGNYYVVYAVM